MKRYTSDHIAKKADSKRLRRLEKSREEQRIADKERRFREDLDNCHVRPANGIFTTDHYGKFAPLRTRASKIFEFSVNHQGCFQNLAQLEWVRPIEHWKPHGKSPTSLFYSLAEHLLAKYPMPSFIWSGLWGPQSPALSLITAQVASGKSIYDVVKSGTLPVPLTRKMCHELMQTKGRIPFMEAVRTAQITALGGTRRLISILCALNQGATLHTSVNEEFFNGCFAWFAANPMLDTAQIAPMFDYIEHLHREDPNFSMKGRSPVTFMRGMVEWHGHLSKIKPAAQESWQTIGFKPYHLEKKVTLPGGAHVNEITSIAEILDSKDLATEGRALGHCVYSYLYSIQRGRTSIWSMKKGYGSLHNERMVTIEIDNATRKIVQVRGKHNRQPTMSEHDTICAWASEANLIVSHYR